MRTKSLFGSFAFDSLLVSRAGNSTELLRVGTGQRRSGSALLGSTRKCVCVSETSDSVWSTVITGNPDRVSHGSIKLATSLPLALLNAVSYTHLTLPTNREV